jgi:hypothetical protein
LLLKGSGASHTIPSHRHQLQLCANEHQTYTESRHYFCRDPALAQSAITTTSQGKLIFTLFAGIAEFERDVIRERTMAGLAAARARGRKGGRKPVFTPSKIGSPSNGCQKIEHEADRHAHWPKRSRNVSWKQQGGCSLSAGSRARALIRSPMSLVLESQPSMLAFPEKRRYSPLRNPRASASGGRPCRRR